jgi:hypothetical protein
MLCIVSHHYIEKPKAMGRMRGRRGVFSGYRNMMCEQGKREMRLISLVLCRG